MCVKHVKNNCHTHKEARLTSMKTLHMSMVKEQQKDE
jgi:hypothetical protein